MNTTRDLVGHHGGSGKGDKPRTRLDANYRKNFDGIRWHNSEWDKYAYEVLSYDQIGHKFVKKYP